MHTIGDIVCAAESPETPLLVLETAGTTLRVAAFCGAAAEGALPFGPEDIEAPEALAAGTPQLPEAVDTWSISRLAAVRAQAWGCAQGCARLGGSAMDRVLRRMGRQTSRAHYAAVHAPRPFEPGVSAVPVSGKCWGAEEMENLTEASLDFWLTAGRFCEAFEKRFAAILGRKHALAVNSGSSANLLAMSALASPLLKERQMRPGDEVITVAAGFPTTVAPIVQMGFVPVFVDVTAPTYNAVAEQVAEAVSPKTKAIFMAHTLGNPFDLAAVKAVAERHGLWLVEDSCDALGSTYAINGGSRMCGAFGDLATFSFYPAHHITMGEGGAVVCDNPLLRKIVLSLRDWGRDCWCPPGKDDTCSHRYEWKFPLLPAGYDHKYVYSHLGYNLKISDMQAAVGLAQLDRLEGFTARRRKNFSLLQKALGPLDGKKILLPQATPNSAPSWFGYLLTLAPGISRQPLLEFLNSRHIGTRLLFAGNMTKQPCFENVRYRAPFGLDGTDAIMERTFWVGLYPGLSEDQIAYTAESISGWLAAC